MNIFNKTWVAALACVLSSTAAKAQGDENSGTVLQHVCSVEDIENHAYKMVDFRETPESSQALWVEQVPYHYLAFYQNNVYAAIASTREIMTPKLLEEFFKSYKHVQRFTLTPDGILNLYDNEKIRYSYRCVVILKSKNEYIKGDVVLSGYTRKKKTELYKLYRLWY